MTEAALADGVVLDDDAHHVRRVRAKQMREVAARRALKTQRREENERNHVTKEARRGDSSVHERDSAGTPIGR
ncbi:hypothetical protein [Streptomyces viridochromogenes]|uniref:hypothetical protein n=1 Tax=Streptomyces viridochromogenes TaxID=1938 RepID=UPI000B322A71|nr:hypothetical protein [Streptomyces viridochromogenes]